MAVDTKQIMDLMDEYTGKISAHLGQRFDAKRHDDPGKLLFANMEHSLFMCNEIKRFCVELSSINLSSGDAKHWDNQKKYHSLREKVMRWLGWLQRTLCFFDLYCLEACKKHVMPPGEEFRKDGGTPQLTGKHGVLCASDQTPMAKMVEKAGLQLNPDREIFGVKPEIAMRASHIRTILQGLEPDQVVAVLGEVGYCTHCGSQEGHRCQCTNDD